MPVAFPGLVVGGIKILLAIDPGVIHQNIDVRGDPEQFVNALLRAQVGDGGTDLYAWHHLLERLNAFVHRVDAAPVDDHFRTALRQSAGDGKPNTAGGRGHQRYFPR